MSSDAEREAIAAVRSIERLDGEAYRIQRLCWSESQGCGVGVFQGARRWIVYVASGRVVYIADVVGGDGAIPNGTDGESVGLRRLISELKSENRAMRQRLERVKSAVG